ncbi:MAG: G8 domain-containing protein, partial [bacterium]|nr:G8 domain-containing protein [bacterium]
MVVGFLFSLSRKILLLSLIFLLPEPVWAQGLCQLPDGLQPLSNCVDGSGNALIGPSGGANCERVVFDKSFTGAEALKRITIEAGGEVYAADGSLDVELEAIEVSGLLQIGSKECPIGTTDPSHQITMTFLGARPCPSPQACDGFQKGIQVKAGGSLRLFGIKGVTGSETHGGTETGISWTHLSDAAGPEDKYGPESGAKVPVPSGGSTTIQLHRDVTQGAGAWQPGDWIAIATTSFSSVETEIVQIDSLGTNASGGTEVKLVQALKRYHFGGPDPGPPSLATFNECHGFNYGVDERAEVGLLSRNIKLTARIEAGENDRHWGGELIFLPGFQEVSVQGVQIEKFGKDKLGAYPIHFHQDGDVQAQKPLVNSNSVHHSYNKCVTVHSTSNLTVENNVCARIVGHIFYQEIGDEEGIRFLNNLGLGAMSNHFNVFAASPEEREKKIADYWWPGDHLGQMASPDYNGYQAFDVYATDEQSNPVRGICAIPDPAGGPLILKQNPYVPPDVPGKCPDGQIYFEPASGFWIINPGTDLIGNSIGGCQDVGRGYWYVPPR